MREVFFRHVRESGGGVELQGVFKELKLFQV